MRTCAHCGADLDRGRRSSATDCDHRCRQRAWRRRRAGVPESAYAKSGARGRVALGELTRREAAEARLAELLTTRRAV